MTSESVVCLELGIGKDLQTLPEGGSEVVSGMNESVIWSLECGESTYRASGKVCR